MGGCHYTQWALWEGSPAPQWGMGTMGSELELPCCRFCLQFICPKFLLCIKAFMSV